MSVPRSRSVTSVRPGPACARRPHLGPDAEQERGRRLRVEVPEHGAEPVRRRQGGDVHGGRGLPPPALDVVGGDDLHGRNVSATRACRRRGELGEPVGEALRAARCSVPGARPPPPAPAGRPARPRPRRVGGQKQASAWPPGPGACRDVLQRLQRPHHVRASSPGHSRRTARAGSAAPCPACAAHWRGRRAGVVDGLPPRHHAPVDLADAPAGHGGHRGGRVGPLAVGPEVAVEEPPVPAPRRGMGVAGQLPAQGPVGVVAAPLQQRPHRRQRRPPVLGQRGEQVAPLEELDVEVAGRPRHRLHPPERVALAAERPGREGALHLPQHRSAAPDRHPQVVEELRVEVVERARQVGLDDTGQRRGRPPRPRRCAGPAAAAPGPWTGPRRGHHRRRRSPRRPRRRAPRPARPRTRAPRRGARTGAGSRARRRPRAGAPAGPRRRRRPPRARPAAVAPPSCRRGSAPGRDGPRPGPGRGAAGRAPRSWGRRGRAGAPPAGRRPTSAAGGGPSP